MSTHWIVRVFIVFIVGLFAGRITMNNVDESDDSAPLSSLPERLPAQSVSETNKPPRPRGPVAVAKVESEDDLLRVQVTGVVVSPEQIKVVKNHKEKVQ